MKRPGSSSVAGLLCGSALFVSHLLTEWALAEPGEQGQAVWLAVVLFAGVLGLRSLVSWLRVTGPAKLITIFTLSACCLSVASEFIIRSYYDRELPLELFLLSLIRWLMLAIWLVPSSSSSLNTPTSLPLAHITSAFVVVFGFSQCHDPWAGRMVLIYAGLEAIWLMQFVASSLEARALCKSQRQVAWPIALAVLGICTLVGIATNEFVGISQASLGEYLASSGGTTDRDHRSRGGVNDGDEIVKGEKNAQSDGADSETFLESHEPTLYDAMTDQFGEAKKNQDQQRTVALNPSNITHQENVAKNHQARREFSLQRQSRNKTHASLTDQKANAHFYVYGKTPVHLPIVAYCDFDGVTWSEDPPSRTDVLADVRGHWQRMVAPAAAYHAGTESYRIKIGRIKTRRVILPYGVTTFRVGAIDRPTFFRAVHDGILGLVDANAHVPPGETIQAICNTYDRGRFPTITGNEVPYTLPRYRLPTEQPKLRALAESWTQGLPKGFAQINAVINRLRSGEFTYDRYHVVPKESADRPIEWFLFTGKRGSDYLFASTAAELLRQLGYPTRLVSGYYLDEKSYDAKARCCLATTTDLHFWIEFALPDQTWVPFDPTPGFELMPARRTWWQWACGVVLWFVREGWRQPIVWLAALAVSAGSIGWCRRVTINWLLTGWWQLMMVLFPQECIRHTVSLLHGRGWLGGQHRKPGWTLSRWLKPKAGMDEHALTIVHRFIRYHDRTLFGNQQMCVDERVLECCRAVGKVMTLERFYSPRNKSKRSHAAGKQNVDTVSSVPDNGLTNSVSTIAQ